MNPLEQWLLAATKGLSAESTARVRAEIQEHYDSACEAGDDAIATLGSPRAANRAYRKVLLTDFEASMAPALVQRKPLTLPRFLMAWALPVTVALLLPQKLHLPGFWLIMGVICCTGPLFSLFRPTTLDQGRFYGYASGARNILLVAIVWWYQDWAAALGFCAIFLGLDYFTHYHRMSILRKVAAGQVWSLLPGEPRLTHQEAMVLRTLDKSYPYENVMGIVVVLMATGMAVWQPATFAPVAVFLALGHLTRQTIPFRTEEGSRWFRIAKWTAMGVAAVLPVLLRARGPWAGAFYLAFLFVLFDLRCISLRRKLPVEQWPKKLYW